MRQGTIILTPFKLVFQPTGQEIHKLSFTVIASQNYETVKKF